MSNDKSRGYQDGRDREEDDQDYSKIHSGEADREQSFQKDVSLEEGPEGTRMVQMSSGKKGKAAGQAEYSG